mmetsp:Transcript_55251/g.117842  ORF Transcript_55251/g.117842 Transcript_55251/m.117842 type:complete len:248 (-) Transcript_55251:634-1377(-)
MASPSTGQLFAKHQFGTLSWETMGSQDLFNQLTDEDDGCMSDVPVRVEDALVKGLKQNSRVGSTEVPHQDLSSLHGCVPNGACFVCLRPEQDAQSLLQMGLKGRAHSDGKIHEEAEIAVLHLDLHVGISVAGVCHDVWQQALDAACAHGHEHLGETVRSTVSLDISRGAKHLEHPLQGIPQHVLWKTLGQSSEGLGHSGSHVWHGVHQSVLQLGQQGGQVGLDVLGISDQNHHRTHELRTFPLHLCR